MYTMVYMISLNLYKHPSINEIVTNLLSPEGTESRFGEYFGIEEGEIFGIDFLKSYLIAPDKISRVNNRIGAFIVRGKTNDDRAAIALIDPFAEISFLGSLTIYNTLDK